MTAEMVNRWIAESSRTIDGSDWDAYGELFSEALLMRTPGLPGITTGREARVAAVKAITDAFPDGHVEVERTFERGDWACLQMQFIGTHTGRLSTAAGRSIPPSGRFIRIPYCIAIRFGDAGEVIEINEYFDQLDLLGQIGSTQ